MFYEKCRIKQKRNRLNGLGLLLLMRFHFIYIHNIVIFVNQLKLQFKNISYKKVTSELL